MIYITNIWSKYAQAEWVTNKTTWLFHICHFLNNSLSLFYSFRQNVIKLLIMYKKLIPYWNSFNCESCTIISFSKNIRNTKKVVYIISTIHSYSDVFYIFIMKYDIEHEKMSLLVSWFSILVLYKLKNLSKSIRVTVRRLK